MSNRIISVGLLNIYFYSRGLEAIFKNSSQRSGFLALRLFVVEIKLEFCIDLLHSSYFHCYLFFTSTIGLNFVIYVGQSGDLSRLRIQLLTSR